MQQTTTPRDILVGLILVVLLVLLGWIHAAMIAYQVVRVP
jgi:hypothetical protein